MRRTPGDKSDHVEQAGTGLLADYTADGKPIGIEIIAPAQGARDTFGKPDEVAGYALAPSIRLVWIEDGDHSFKPRRQSGRTWDQNLDQAVAAVLEFSASL